MKTIIGPALGALSLAAASTALADTSYLGVRAGALWTSGDALSRAEDGSSYGPWSGIGVIGGADFEYASDTGITVGGGLRLSAVSGADDPDQLHVVDLTALRLPVSIGWTLGDGAVQVSVGGEASMAFLWLNARDEGAGIEEAGGGYGVALGPFLAAAVPVADGLDLSLRLTGLFTVARTTSDVTMGRWDDGLVRGFDVPLEVGLRWAL